jgi:hypothetical protein
MYKTAKADRDTYITNKVVKNARVVSSNTGLAGTLDLFKLYGNTFDNLTPNAELSRLLLHFDLEELKSLHSEGKIDISDNSFWCSLVLKDVYGGQTTPSNFSVSVFPLSSSFYEGMGKDVSYYTDRDASNWLTSSYGNPWYVTGCSLACGDNSPGDYITSSLLLGSTESVQTFKTGTEDLIVDVTKVVSATVAGILPDCGFRVSMSPTIEGDNRTYFVKRFASRHAYNEAKRPSLVYGFDDSVTDDTQNLVFDVPSKINLYNYVKGSASNILSASSYITGSNCLILKMTTEISGGFYQTFFTGSQMTLGINYVTGAYTATVNIQSSDPDVAAKIASSGSVDFSPYWTSIDGSIVYSAGEKVTVRQPDRSSSTLASKSYVVTVTGLKTEEPKNSVSTLRVNVFDQTSPLIKVVKVPVELPGVVLSNVFYSVRDAVTGETVIPFDTTKNSTRVSSDASGMFFRLYTSALTPGRTYTIDILINESDKTQKYVDCSPVFRIEE